MSRRCRIRSKTLLVALVALASAGCATSNRSLLVSDDAFVPSLQKFTLAVPPTLDLPSLRDTALRDGRKEIRVWNGFGIEEPMTMLRLQIDADGGVRADSIAWFVLHDAPDFDADVLASMTQACPELKRREKVAACVLGETPTNAVALYRRLRSENIWTLRDESRLPATDSLVIDGVAMVVELRDGDRYRAYQYSNPQYRTDPEAEAAAKILRDVDSALYGGVRRDGY